MFEGTDRKKQILDAATKLFAEKGFHHTTVGEIANFAGVGKGTVYEYFPSKKDVLKELLAAAIEYYFGLFPSKVAGNLKLKEKLHLMTSLHFWFFLEHRDIARVVLYEHRQITEDLEPIMVKKEQERISYVAAILEEGSSRGEIRPVDCQLAARVISGALWNMGMDLVLSPSVYDGDELINGVVDILWSGLKS
ncbi:MAG: TetR/AcrR family transcriptional regulator [Bacillota bacterium]